MIRPLVGLETDLLIFMSFYFYLNRNIGYGLQNTMARVGAIIGPQLVTLVTYLLTLYSRTSMARTPMARLPRLFQTRS